jgi:predicted RNA-binding protein with PIN domain
MSYLIDGYNLIGFCDSISLGSSDKEQALSRLLSSLSDKEMHIVFDGKNANYPYGSREKRSEHTLIFTPPDQSADDYIKECCTKSRYKQWFVVTNDRDILYTCKKTSRISLSCDGFLRQIVQRQSQSPGAKPSPTPSNIQYWLKQFGDDS